MFYSSSSKFTIQATYNTITLQLKVVLHPGIYKILELVTLCNKKNYISEIIIS